VEYKGGSESREGGEGHKSENWCASLIQDRGLREKGRKTRLGDLSLLQEVVTCQKHGGQSRRGGQ